MLGDACMFRGLGHSGPDLGYFMPQFLDTLLVLNARSRHRSWSAED